MTRPSTNLPATLAERIRFLREKRYMTPEAVAIKAQVSLRMVEDIEAGIEIFLAPAVRQRLARVLHVRPQQIQEVEKVPPTLEENAPDMRRKGIHLHEDILQDPDAAHTCPSCGALLEVRVFERRDLRDNPLTVIKANCTKCLFRLSDD